MHSEGFTDDAVEDGEGADFFVLHGAPGTVGLEEVLDLFFVEFFTVVLGHVEVSCYYYIYFE